MLTEAGALPARPLHLPARAHSDPIRAAAYWLTWLTILTIPWEADVRANGIGSLSRLLGICAGVAGLMAVATSWRRRRLRSAHVLMIAFASWAAASFYWSVAPDRTPVQVFTLAQLVVLALLAWELSPGRRTWSLTHAYLIGCWILTAVLLYKWATGATTHDYRLTLGDSTPNDPAFMLCLAIPLAWYASCRVASRLEVVAMRLLVPVALLGIVLTASRSSLLVAGIALVFVPWTISSLAPRARVALIFATICCALAAPMLLPEQQTERLGTTVTELTSGTLNSRTVVWSAAEDSINDHLILGTGAGTSKMEIKRISGLEQGAHNTFLDTALELGVVGAALLTLLMLSVLLELSSGGGYERKLAVVMGLTLLVGLQVRHWEYAKPLWAVLAVMLELFLINSTAPALERPQLHARPGRQ